MFTAFNTTKAHNEHNNPQPNQQQQLHTKAPHPIGQKAKPLSPHYNWPDSTCNTTRSVSLSTPLGWYSFFKLAPKIHAKVW